MREHKRPLIPGTIVSFGGRDWTVAPLTLGQLRHLLPKLGQLSAPGAGIGEAQISVIVEIVTAALRRNYPEIGEEVVENLLDLGNAGAVLSAVLAGSGLRPGTHPAGEAVAPELGSGAKATKTAGDVSTASSQPRADTVIR